MKTTEEESFYNNLEKMDINNILQSINTEDKKVALSIENQYQNYLFYLI